MSPRRNEPPDAIPIEYGSDEQLEGGEREPAVSRRIKKPRRGTEQGLTHHRGLTVRRKTHIQPAPPSVEFRDSGDQNRSSVFAVSINAVCEVDDFGASNECILTVPDSQRESERRVSSRRRRLRCSDAPRTSNVSAFVESAPRVRSKSSCAANASRHSVVTEQFATPLVVLTSDGRHRRHRRSLYEGPRGPVWLARTEDFERTTITLQSADQWKRAFQEFLRDEDMIRQQALLASTKHTGESEYAVHWRKQRTMRRQSSYALFDSLPRLERESRTSIYDSEAGPRTMLIRAAKEARSIIFALTYLRTRITSFVKREFTTRSAIEQTECLQRKELAQFRQTELSWTGVDGSPALRKPVPSDPIPFSKRQTFGVRLCSPDGFVTCSAHGEPRATQGKPLPLFHTVESAGCAFQEPHHCPFFARREYVVHAVHFSKHFAYKNEIAAVVSQPVHTHRASYSDFQLLPPPPSFPEHLAKLAKQTCR
ncbi:hypothetical protein DIPPA_52433 [Diplonema papillatum]|nr:hypothetical protein DIPPA_52433 [Diplonema papillatum]